jgi:nitroreductase
MSNSFLSNLQWRFATKAFDNSKKVTSTDLQKILEAIRFSPSSFGLQPYHIEVISNTELREKLKTHAWHQPQITEASHILVFSARTDIMTRIDAHMNDLAGGKAEVREQLKDYEGMMTGFAEQRTPEWIKTWAERQAYIALGFALAACAELRIDACPIEGFDPIAFDKELSHPDHLKSVVCLAIGYRREGPARPKCRFPEKDLFTSLS